MGATISKVSSNQASGVSGAAKKEFGLKTSLDAPGNTGRPVGVLDPTHQDPSLGGLTPHSRSALAGRELSELNSGSKFGSVLLQSQRAGTRDSVSFLGLSLWAPSNQLLLCLAEACRARPALAVLRGAVGADQRRGAPPLQLPAEFDRPRGREVSECPGCRPTQTPSPYRWEGGLAQGGSAG